MNVAALSKIGASSSNIGMDTPLTRGKLNSQVGCGSEEMSYAWLAGLFDGEGTMGLYRCRIQGSLTCTKQFCIDNTDLKIITQARDILENIVKHSVSIVFDKRVDLEHQRKCYGVILTNQADIIATLNTLEPYLVGKKAQAHLLLETLSNHRKGAKYTEAELAVVDMLKALKRESFANPELNGSYELPKCVETIYEAPQAGDEIVHPSMKIEEQGVLGS